MFEAALLNQSKLDFDRYSGSSPNSAASSDGMR